jgi:putative redox protein
MTTSEAPEQLKLLLQDFAGRLAQTETATEAVSVAVQRRAGFSNQGRTSKGHIVNIDEPEHFGGSGAAPDPAELLLCAAGASLSVTLTAHAALRGIALHDVQSRLTAHIHGPSFFSPHENALAGLLNISIDLLIASPHSEQEIRALLADVLRATPVLRTFAQPPRVNLTLQSA